MTTPNTTSNMRGNSDERGLVSITITVIIMLVISITVLSFSQIIRREQRQALDTQLSSQAFYAAESGVNDARNYIQTTWLANGQRVPEKINCGSTSEYPLSGLPMTIDASTSTSYSCLLVTGQPKDLEYDLSSSAPSKVFPIDADGATISKINLEWSPSTTTNPLNGCPASAAAALPKADSWPCTGYGIIRIDLVPMTTLSRSAFMGNTFTAFITPTNNSSPTSPTVSYTGSNENISAGAANQGARPSAYCNADRCNITINNLSATKYFARVSSIYRDTTLKVSAEDAFNNRLPLIGAQIMIDSTGRSQDVLRRIQVRVPLVNDGLHADYSIQTNDSMCKLITTYPGYPTTGC